MSPKTFVFFGDVHVYVHEHVHVGFCLAFLVGMQEATEGDTFRP